MAYGDGWYWCGFGGPNAYRAAAAADDPRPERPAGERGGQGRQIDRGTVNHLDCANNNHVESWVGLVGVVGHHYGHYGNLII